MATEQPEQVELEGVDSPDGMGDYPIDSLQIRSETRTIFEVVRRIGQGVYIMDPEFQRDFVWGEDRQSRLIESVLMRIPLPVIYLAENKDGRLVVVDGLQRLTTFERFLNKQFTLRLKNVELHGRSFNELPAKLQNRIEDAQLILYLIDSTVPERARLDIFERVNSGVPLSRQQMRNALYQGKATACLLELARHPTYLEATGRSLDTKAMRDREAINRFCAFHLLGPEKYNDDMDQFLADALTQMNRLSKEELEQLKALFLRSMQNNIMVFGRHAFRKHGPDSQARKTFNMSLFDVFSTGLARYEPPTVESHKRQLQEAFYRLMGSDEFIQDITYGTSDLKRVQGRFQAVQTMLKGVFGAH